MGTHNSGIYLDTVSCYDRVNRVWHNPLGTLPMGLDHSNAIHMPKHVCNNQQPERVLITNFRNESYGDATCDVWAFDLPPRPNKKWYLFSPCPEGWVGRDAAGVVMANGGRLVLTLGGVHYHKKSQKSSTVFGDVVSFDVCTKKRTVIGNIGYERFALQSCASGSLNVVVTCGGQPHRKYMRHLYQYKKIHKKAKVPQSLYNFPYCSVNFFPWLLLQPRQGGSIDYGNMVQSKFTAIEQTFFGVNSTTIEGRVAISNVSTMIDNIAQASNL